jgi:hypothetical protein
MTDLNTAIAKYKGWTPENGLKLSVEHIIRVENGLFLPPDFERDARLYMALFEEMPRPALRKWGNRWYCMPDMDRSSKVQWVEYDADTIGTAICIAYAKWKGIEVVG